jgi:hypothetical protein
MTRSIKIELPENLFQQLQRTAELSRLPVAAIVEQSLAHSLPPLLEEIPEAYQPEVYPLLGMDAAQLQSELQRIFPPERWERYEALLQKKKTTSLTAAETKELAQLRREADALTFRKAYAAVLLRRRGRQILDASVPFH